MSSDANAWPRQRRRPLREGPGVVQDLSTSIVNSPSIYKDLTKFVFPLLVCFRIINALCVRTFFQPDEYFQSLEPAWQIAFGRQSGAWITWEWQHQLRSSLHPAIFAALYMGSEKVIESLAIAPQLKATVLIILPKMLQGAFAAVGDYFTWKLAERIYGCENSSFAWTALFMSVLSPWQWFCSTRTLSNSLEVVLTAAALYLWPWGLPGIVLVDSREESETKVFSLSSVFQSHPDVLRLRLCLVLAAVACILRPTNLLIWLSLVTIIIIRIGISGLNSSTRLEFALFAREIVFCGASVICFSAISDRLYFGIWTFPPYQWLTFNITQSLAIFYGTNDWHYYLSQGLPLLLTSYVPFFMHALMSITFVGFARPVLRNGRPSDIIYNNRPDLVFVILTTLTTLSLISHKEVRFIYPLLPCLHVLAAPSVLSFFALQSPPIREKIKSNQFRTTPEQVRVRHQRVPLLILLTIMSIVVGLYATQVHQRGVIDVLTFLRHEYEELHVSGRRKMLGDKHSGNAMHMGRQGNDSIELFAAFLMPCHSTPWRSHLVYPNLQAWALTCEPPLHIPASSPARASYRDEADRFYDDPVLFLETEMHTTDRGWPRYLVGFEGIESLLLSYCEAKMPGRRLRERWRGFNSHWHDDPRRQGAVVVWDFTDH